MSRIILISILLLSLVAASADASVIEIPLPGLLGSYPVSESISTRTVTFHLPDPPGVVYGVSFRISGMQTVGSITCEWGGPYPWPMQFSANMHDAPNGYWLAGLSPPEEAGSFTSSAPFTASLPGTTWTFLMDGEGQVTLNGSPAGLVALCFENPVPPTGEITEAVLIIDADFPIRTESSTWGKIKALYRN